MQHEALTIDAFELLKVIGKGSFGKVMQVRKKDTGRIYALKTIRKAHIVSRSEVTHTLAERTVLGHITSPFMSVPLNAPVLGSLDCGSWRLAYWGGGWGVACRSSSRSSRRRR